jgi:hypothetical protein
VKGLRLRDSGTHRVPEVGSQPPVPPAWTAGTHVWVLLRKSPHPPEGTRKKPGTPVHRKAHPRQARPCDLHLVLCRAALEDILHGASWAGSSFAPEAVWGRCCPLLPSASFHTLAVSTLVSLIVSFIYLFLQYWGLNSGPTS